MSTLVGVVLLLLLCGAGAAAAEPPPRLADRVTDRAGALDPAGRAAVTAAIDDLRAADGVDLFVVYVRSFDDADGQSWADRAAQRSQLGDGDVLLAVATEDRAYGTSFPQDFPLSESATDGIVRDDVEPRLSAGDWAGAAAALANGLRDGGGGGEVGTVVAVVGGVVVVGGGAYLLLSRRRRAGTAPTAPGGTAGPDGPKETDEFSGVSTEDLSYRGSQALLEIDDAVRTSEQELSAARAHFGDDAVAGFAAALEQSRAEMLRGFTLRQQLDDEVPEDEPTRRSMLAEIVLACRSADERLDAQVAAFDQLRGLEADAPGYLAGLRARLDAATARMPQVDAAAAALRGRYAAAALEPVAGNLDQARRLLGDAAEQLGVADSALAAGPGAATTGPGAATPGAATPAPGAGPAPSGRVAGPAAAVVAGRAAEDAVTQASTLMDSVGRLEGELVAASERIAAARAETEQDLAEARALRDAGGAGDLAGPVARAEAALASAAEAEWATPPDPLAALRLIADADAVLDQGLAQARETQDRARRTAAALEQTLITARSSVGAAEDFVSTRRGAVGAGARTRLAEAHRHLQQAQAGGDPAVALREAQTADEMGRAALRMAQSDVSSWSGPGAGSGRGASLGVELGGLVLGGILSGGLGGGRGGGGGFGGGGFGGGPASFGGSATRGRRGGGGRF